MLVIRIAWKLLCVFSSVYPLIRACATAFVSDVTDALVALFQSITRSTHAQQCVDEQRVLGLVLPLDDDDAATDDAIQCRADTDQS